MPIPPALQGWFRSNYPTLVFNPDWLSACVEYLQSTDAQCNSTTSVLIKAVESQLLSSDLSTSVSLSSPILTQNRATLSTVHPATVPQEDRTVLKGGKRASVLFQVEKVDDVGHSASSLLEIVREKREWNKLKLKGGEGKFDQGRDMRLDNEDDEGESDGGRAIEEEEKRILAGADGKAPTFPRGSGKFVLSDGANLVVAFELQRIPGLGLGEVKLGTKLLLHDVTFLNGLMLLTPQNTIVKGHDVEELEQFSEWTLENSLRARLELEPLPKPVEARGRSPPGRSPSTPPKPEVKPTRRTRALVAAQANPRDPSPRPRAGADEPLGDDDEFDLDGFGEEDDGIDYDALQARAIAATKPPSSSRRTNLLQHELQQQQQQQVRTERGGESPRDDEFEMGDLEQLDPVDDDDDDDEGWNVLNELEQTRDHHRAAPSRRQRVDARTDTDTKGQGRGGSVKTEQRSSGGGGGSGTARMTTTRIEVLELDSDGDDNDGNVGTRTGRPPAAKRAKVGGSEEVTVLELDDSSD